MKNRIVVFANQKGGVGKSTLCMLFADYLAWKKQDVCIIDTDLQKSITMQRKKDRELFEQEDPYTIQDFDVTDPETMQQLMDSARETEGYVLFDSPGNISEDGLIPMFTSADFIICPYEYEEKTLDSTGTMVHAAHDGTVMEAAYDSYYGNYVVITDSKGYTTKYAHMDSLNVSAGQSVKKGANIGKSGNTGSSTGSHLHIECLYNGEYYNPLFYFEAGEQTIYGETPGGTGGGTGNVIPPESYDDATVQTLMREANRYLGMPYTFGGTAPASFDCSGFVCWVFTNSGVHNLPRTTAQGIYDQCTPVSAADAKAGDIIFFTGTYNAGRPVTHVGIYCGNGTMVHCGDPIQYTSINTSYWQSHFYGFGRLN